MMAETGTLTSRQSKSAYDSFQSTSAYRPSDFPKLPAVTTQRLFLADFPPHFGQRQVLEMCALVKQKNLGRVTVSTPRVSPATNRVFCHLAAPSGEVSRLKALHGYLYKPDKNSDISYKLCVQDARPIRNENKPAHQNQRSEDNAR